MTASKTNCPYFHHSQFSLSSWGKCWRVDFLPMFALAYRAVASVRSAGIYYCVQTVQMLPNLPLMCSQGFVIYAHTEVFFHSPEKMSHDSPCHWPVYKSPWVSKAPCRVLFTAGKHVCTLLFMVEQPSVGHMDHSVYLRAFSVLLWFRYNKSSEIFAIDLNGMWIFTPG